MLGGLAYQNDFRLVGHGQPYIRYFFENQKQELAKLLCEQNKVLYARHIYFMDLSEFGCEARYFNMVSILYCILLLSLIF